MFRTDSEQARQPRKIGHAIEPISMPEGVDVPVEVAQFNADVAAYLQAPPLTTDPFAIESFAAYLGMQFDRLRTRCLLHRRRIALLSNNGAARKAVIDKRREIDDARKRLHHQIVGAAVEGNDKALGTKVKEAGSPVDRACDDVLKGFARWEDRHGHPFKDKDAAAKCEALLREAFAGLVIADDLVEQQPEKKRVMPRSTTSSWR